MNIVLGITSSIAAYKMIDFARLLRDKKHNVSIIMTEKATHLIDPQIFIHEQFPVFTELFASDFSVDTILKKRSIDHIQVAQNADLFIVAPATANSIAKIAHGIADDFLTTALLATTAPVLICPAMNTVMWNNPAVQNNLRLIATYGHTILEPDSGILACGTDGIGRLPSLSVIEEKIEYIFHTSHLLKGKKILITAGGTNEPIDAARTIANKSTGKMGIALAEECKKRGADVILLRSQTAYPTNLIHKTFQTSSELKELMKQYCIDADCLIHTAAVSDFTVETQEKKLESGIDHQIILKPAQKIINEIKQWKPDILLVGFKAVYGDDNELIQTKALTLKKDSQADLIIINDISRTDIGFGADENEVYLFDTKQIKKIPKSSKKHIAQQIMDYIQPLI